MSLCALLLSAPAASAGLVDEVLPPGVEIEAPTQPLPNVLPPIEVPSTPELPPLPAPTPAAPEPPAPVNPSKAVGEVAAGAEEAAEAVTRLPSEVVGKLHSGSNSGSGGTAGDPAPGKGEQGAPTIDARRPESSIDPAAAAPLRRLLAYVWPAVALEFSEVGMPLLARLAVAAGIPVADALGLLSGLLPAVLGVEADSSPGNQATPREALLSPPEVPVLGDGMGLLLSLVTAFLAAVSLLAMARLLVGEELFEPRRWRHHRGL